MSSLSVAPDVDGYIYNFSKIVDFIIDDRPLKFVYLTYTKDAISKFVFIIYSEDI